MKSSTAILLGAATLLGYVVVEKYQAGVNLTYKLKNISVGNVILGQPLPLVLTFTLTNPTDEPLTLNGISGNILVNNNLLSKVNSTVEATIPINNSIDYPINFSLPVTQSVSDILSVLHNNSGATVSFNGIVSAEGINIPLTTSETV